MAPIDPPAPVTEEELCFAHAGAAWDCSTVWDNTAWYPTAWHLGHTTDSNKQAFADWNVQTFAGLPGLELEALQAEERVDIQDGAPQSDETSPCGMTDLSPPPGLDLPQSHVQSSTFLLGREFPKEEPRWAGAVPQGFQVLLRNVPDEMVDVRAIHAILEGWMLDDGLTGICFRQGGKVLLAFSSYSHAVRCVGHFNAQPFGVSDNSVLALYVQTVKTKTRALARAIKHQGLSVDAPAFVPSSVPSVSVDATVFNLGQLDCEGGGRAGYCSGLSTGPHSSKMSEDSASDS